MKARKSIQETATVRLRPVQGTIVCPFELKGVGEGVFTVGLRLGDGPREVSEMSALWLEQDTFPGPGQPPLVPQEGRNDPQDARSQALSGPTGAPLSTPG